MEKLAQLSERSNARLEQLESDWLKGRIPDVASYLRQSAGDGPRAWQDLVELDLEYRWRRFQHTTSSSDLDPFGFPQYPRLEHYADLLDEAARPQLLNPELLAEEYRVRTFWGDRPDRGQFLDRLPEESDSVEIALELMDEELEIEGMSTHCVDRFSEETTQLFDQRSGELSETLPGTEVPTRIGKYRLQELLGRGGFGEVWKAHDPDLNRPVALKFPNPKRELSPEMYRSFRREAENMASLERVAGVVPVYEAGESRGIPFIAASFIDGEDLSARQQENPLSYEESARITADVAATLHRAHLKDLFHRDVKLSNILIDKEGQVFLSDFGLCVSEQEQLHEGHSATGTYAYMAPEQIHGNSHRVDGRADIYALGVVLYRLLTGRLPFIGNTSVEYMEQTLRKSPRPPRSIDDRVPEELERICLKCLNKKVEDRYSTAGDLARDLRHWLAGIEPVAASITTEAPPVTQTGFGQRHPVLMALAMLFIGVGGMFLLRDSFSDSGIHQQQQGMLAKASNEQKMRRDDLQNAEGADRRDDKRAFDNVPNVEDVNHLYLQSLDPSSLVPVVNQLEEAAWVIRDNGNAVEAYTNNSHYCLASLGRLTPEIDRPITLEVDLIAMKPGSSAGFFYGMSEPHQVTGKIHWQTVIIERTQEGNFRLLMHYYEYEKHAPRFHSQHDDEDLILPESDRHQIRLSVTVSNDGIEGIGVNDQNFDWLAEEYRGAVPRRTLKDRGTPAWNFQGTGIYGLQCRWNQGTFANPRINGNSYTFKFKKQGESREF